MKVLLTGSSGFVGKNVLAYLRKKTGWDIDCPSTKELFNELEDRGRYDYIVHLASASSVEQSVKDPVPFIMQNINSLTTVLEYARKYPPDVFLHFSTVEVYNVTNPYAASKAAQEEVVNAYWKTYGIPAVILRSSNIVGPGQTPDKFVPKIVEQIKNSEEVTIYAAQGKLGMREYNPVGNVADAILFLIKSYPFQNYRQPSDFPIHFDLTGGKRLTNLKMAQIVAHLLRRPLKYRVIEPHHVRPTYARALVPSGTKLSALGWKPPQTLYEGLIWIK